jgi:DNA-binding CsgD family transcriptional regulator/tetratricopeptide (TPR) repeat protein
MTRPTVVDQAVSAHHRLVALRVSSPVLIGREADLEQLREVCDRAAQGSPTTVLVAGEAGVGKSRLIGEICAWAEEHGAVAVTGGCLDVGDAVLPFAPILEALRRLLRLLDDEELDRVLDIARPELARLLPELGQPPAGPIVPGRLFEHLLGTLHRVAERRPLLLAIEDTHWADRSTRDLLGFLARNLRLGVVLMLTYRTDEMHRRHPLRPFLAELERGGRGVRLDLDRLGRRDLARLIAEVTGETPPASLVDEVMARSEGNTFYAEELLAAHRAGVRLPAGLRDLVLARVDTLSEPAQQMLGTAAIAGRRVDHELLAEVAQLPLDRLVTLLREAVSQQVIVVESGSDGSDVYSFRHALIQEAVYDDLLAVQRTRLHAAYARELAARIGQRAGLPGTDPASPVELGQLAYHWYAAHNQRQALLAYLDAAIAAEASYGLAEAERFYERAAELWEQVPDAAAISPLDRTTVYRRAAETAYLVFDPARATALADLALAGCDPADRLLIGQIMERKARYLWAGTDSRGAMAVLEEAAALIPEHPPSPERARVLAAHGQMLVLTGRLLEGCERCTRAIAVASEAGAPGVRGHALNSLGASLAMLGDVDTGIARLHQALTIAEELADADDICRANINLGSAYLQAGRTTDACDVYLAALEFARRHGMARGYGAAALAGAVATHTQLGRWEDAERLLTEGFDLDLAPMMAARLLRARARWRIRRGEPDLGYLDLVQATSAAGTGGRVDPQDDEPARTLLVEAHLWAGRPYEARMTVTEGLDLLDRAAVTHPSLVVRLCRSGVAAEADIAERARAANDAAELAGATKRCERLSALAHAAVQGVPYPVTPSDASLLAALDADGSRVTGRSDPSRWAHAVRLWESLGYRFDVAYARWRLAEALLARGERAEAAAGLAQAWQEATRLGARGLISQIESLARRSRIELGAPRAEPVAQAPAQPGDQFSLTPREREVLLLVADGRTNRQIAAKLYISEKTASVHVSRILGKLGVANRAEAAAVAHRLGMT